MIQSFILQFDSTEDLEQSLHISNLISINLNVSMMDFVSTHSRPLLFEGCSAVNLSTYWPKIEIAHESTWDDFGRAYYSSCSYQFTGFHFTLYSVDELRQQIEAKMLQYEQNRIVSGSCLIARGCCSSPLERYFAENLWDEDLYAWVEDFKARNVYARNLRVTDDHSCRPFYNTSIYLHQLAKLSLSVQNAQTSAALRPCCRSFLMASCRQLSGDDSLGH